VLLLLSVDLVEVGPSYSTSDLSYLRSIFVSFIEGRNSIPLYCKVGP
jgi:hypothetical protein